jgi:hypothetical protein
MGENQITKAEILSCFQTLIKGYRRKAVVLAEGRGWSMECYIPENKGCSMHWIYHSEDDRELDGPCYEPMNGSSEWSVMPKWVKELILSHANERNCKLDPHGSCGNTSEMPEGLGTCKRKDTCLTFTSGDCQAIEGDFCYQDYMAELDSRKPSSRPTSEYRCANCMNEDCDGMVSDDPDGDYDDYQSSGFCPEGQWFSDPRE